jgi:hypothetical protein
VIRQLFGERRENHQATDLAATAPAQAT